MKKLELLSKNQETIIGLLHEKADIRRVDCNFEVKLDTKVGRISLPIRIDMRDVEDLSNKGICRLNQKTNKIAILELVNA